MAHFQVAPRVLKSLNFQIPFETSLGFLFVHFLFDLGSLESKPGAISNICFQFWPPLLPLRWRQDGPFSSCVFHISLPYFSYTFLFHISLLHFSSTFLFHTSLPQLSSPIHFHIFRTHFSYTFLFNNPFPNFSPDKSDNGNE